MNDFGYVKVDEFWIIGLAAFPVGIELLGIKGVANAFPGVNCCVVGFTKQFYF